MPFIQSKNPYPSSPLVAALLNSLVARPAAALLTTPTVHLFTANSNPVSQNSVAGDFTQATFHGYAASPVTLSVVAIELPSGLGQGLMGVVNFVCVSPGISENILGYWIDDGAGSMYLAELFQAPVPIVSPGDFVSLAVMFGVMTPTQTE